MGTLITIVRLLPALMELVRSLESLIQQSGMGRTKLAIAQEVLNAAYFEADDAKPTISPEKWQTICLGLINRIVAIFNEQGIFKQAKA